MNFGRIRRGPMAADAFTQIRNALFRDPRLSFKDKGVFGLISTHRDGFGVSAEAIAACSTDGVSSVKVALRNLERYGYLQRTQQRGEGGRLGASVYFITDQPEAFEGTVELENPRSAPSVDFPSTAEPPAVGPSTVEPLAAEPPAENHPHKNTNSKYTSGQNTTSPSRLPRQAAPLAREEEVRSTNPTHNRAQMLLQTLPMPWTCGPKDAARLAPLLADTAATRGWEIGDQLAAAICTNPIGVNNYPAVLEKDRIPNLRPYSQVHGPRHNLPPACQPCLDNNPHAARNPRFRTHNGRPCPTCHPDALRPAA